MKTPRLPAARLGSMILGLAAAIAPPARACDVALLLAIDVSGSIDAGEYRLQAGGLAAALADPEIAEVLLTGQVALAVVQWSGSGQQVLSLPWRRMLRPSEVRSFAERAAAMPRAYSGSDTAVGEAVGFAAAAFAPVADCRRKVIDISGDGPLNAGAPVGPPRAGAIAAGIDINAIAIEDMGRASPISAFYLRQVITPEGFVMTARGLGDYPRAIREKILREVARPLG